MHPRIRRDIYALVGLLAITALPLWRYLFTWPTPLIFPVSALGTDLPREIWPLAHYIVSAMRQSGHLPLWRPYLLSGAPLIGHPIAPVLYPPNWIVLFLPLPLALNLNALFHLWLAGAGVYLYLRLHTATRREAAFLGAAFFAFCPKWIAHLSGGHWPTLAAIVWWPWVWLGFVRFWATGRRRWAVLLGVALAAQAMNHGAYLALSLLWLVGCTLGLLAQQRLAGVRRALLGWGIALPVMVGLAAGQLLPLLELLPYLNRTSLTPAEATFSSLPPPLLSALLFPPSLKYPEWFIFPGVAVLALSLASWAPGWSRRERLWAVGALVGLVMSLGSYTPLYGWLSRLVPVLALFRNPTRWSLFTLFALSLLAAWGVDKWLNGGLRRTRRLVVAFVGPAVIYLVASAFSLAVPGLLPFAILPSGPIFLAAALLLAWPPSKWSLAALTALALADLWVVAASLIRPEVETALVEHPRTATFLQSAAAIGERSFAPYTALSASTLAQYDLRAADGYDSVQLAAYAALARRAAGCDYSGYAVAVPPTQASPDALRACPQFRPAASLLRLLNVRYVILPNKAPPVNGPPLLVEKDISLYDIGPGLGRAFGVARTEAVEPTACLDRLLQINPAAQALIESPPPAALGRAAPTVLSSQPIQDGVIFEVQASQPGLLVRSEAWAPGWRAWVDGQPAQVLRADCALQGVWLAAGVRQVRFHYEPRSYLVGVWLSLVTALALSGWGLWRLYCARRAAAGAPSQTPP